MFKIFHIAGSVFRSLLIIVLFGAVFFPAACDDDFGEILNYELINPGLIIPTGWPVPGDNGIITVLGKNENSIQLQWVQASDDKTLTDDLEYKVVLSLSNNIQTVAAAESVGIIVLDWTPNITVTTATSLSELTTYYFNVLVKDGDGNRSAYTTVSAATTGTVVFMFSSGPHQGNLTTMYTASARKDIDSYCINAKYSFYADLPCVNIRSFISISGTDSIASMPVNFKIPKTYRVEGPDGDVISGSWNALLDGNIDQTLADAGIVFDQWWSGSNYDGSYDATSDNCNGWTNTSLNARAGKHNKTDNSWIFGLEPNCSASYDLLCICW